MEQKDTKSDITSSETGTSLSIKDLKFIPNRDVRLIPKYLLEQVSEMDETIIKRFYGTWMALCNNPLNFFYYLVNEAYVIKGILWARIDAIEALWYVELCSIDKEYQKASSDNMKLLSEFLLSLPVGSEMRKKIQFATEHPKAFEKIGFKQSKRVLIEYEVTENENKR